MKASPWALTAAAVAAVASPLAALQPRTTALEALTDRYLFELTLPEFMAEREARNPESVNWNSDGCTDSPDNPFHFPFLPACRRHDFGYNNYRSQNRWAVSAKRRIDENFLMDLDFQCKSVWATKACKALARVYYLAVRKFGGKDAPPGKRELWPPAYAEAMAHYEIEVKRAQELGHLPILES
ncbi:uncharacterized protein UV8b_00278 [Ustilaginoidea virens]|uniref:Secretory phospholipase A2 n=1 Tax=Ustilaginoidea virens TaxID=1159556 RepID=A0A8E5MDY2_USTVR|nr:uncharacterized protein UV8b_00278 [Ustilaginoidea virens]QUC16037.1 hypothetical protein UV8b_00278 [Ustilaginoidea virens]